MPLLSDRHTLFTSWRGEYAVLLWDNKTTEKHFSINSLPEESYPSAVLFTLIAVASYGSCF